MIQHVPVWQTLTDVIGATATFYSPIIRVYDGQRVWLGGAVYGITGGASASVYINVIRPNGAAGGFYVVQSATTTTAYFKAELLVPPATFRLQYYLSGGVSPTFNVYVDIAIY